MEIFLERENKSLKLRFSGSALELLKKMELNPEAFLVSRKDELVTEDTELHDSDSIKIMSVVSGG